MKLAEALTECKKQGGIGFVQQSGLVNVYRPTNIDLDSVEVCRIWQNATGDWVKPQWHRSLQQPDKIPFDGKL